jgi:uncharacterized NAD(P)/FAD-binding protein YdhS
MTIPCVGTSYRQTAGDIAIVGGGTAAVCLLAALSHRLWSAGQERGSIVVFEPVNRLWHGRVYGDDAPAVITYAPLPTMSLHADDPVHPCRWLAEWMNLSTSEAATRFVPRALFGSYLVAEAAAAEGRLRAGNWTVRHIAKRVEEIEIVDGAVVVNTASVSMPFRLAVLCVGGSQQADPFGLDGMAGFIRTPYPVSLSLADIPSWTDVAVIGTGPTAVDVAVGLAARGHRGRIMLTSRRGLLPAVRSHFSAVPYSFTELTAQRIGQLAEERAFDLGALIGLAHAELKAGGHDPASLDSELALDEPPLMRLRRHLTAGLPPALRILQQATPFIGQQAWSSLPEAEQSDLLAQNHALIMSLCCPMPRVTASRLLALAESGQLEVLPGLLDIAPSRRGGFQATTRIRRLQVPIVVSAATDAKHPIHPDAQPLVASLIRQRVAVPDPHGGLRVDPTTSRLTADGLERRQPLFALGDLTHGSFYFTSGMAVLTRRANEIAGEIQADLRDRLVSTT